ncbi:MAG TPA: hypothetical protein DD381_03275 [Lentisphaeria bacterium]|nr:MAG: hypothetical protein A2X47_02975 [Lentisphaerae bacterium GWF2_38_69]HBM15354.1 hypothetical protein [Lentisphaeria bacterium]
MKLTVKTKYGLSVLIQLCSDDSQTPVTGKAIAQLQNISESYVEQIMIPLTASGIIRTLRGSKGGYILNRESKEIFLLDIIEAYEGKIDFTKSDETGRKNYSMEPCKGLKVWKLFEKSIQKLASEINMELIMEKFLNNSKEGEYII